MTKSEKITFKAKQLAKTYLVDYIEQTDHSTFKKCPPMIIEELEKVASTGRKIEFIEVLISDLKERQSKHQETCPETKKGGICYFDEHYEAALKFLQKEKKELVLSQQSMTFDDKTRAIFKELASRPGREGELEEILETCDIDYIRNDLQEFIRYFKETGMVNTSRITKDGFDIILNQSGIDYMNKPPTTPSPAEKNIIINENYTNSVVAKGENVNQSGLSFSVHQEATMPTKTENNQPAVNATANAQKPASPTKKIQIWQFVVATIGVLIALIMLYLKLNEKI